MGGDATGARTDFRVRRPKDKSDFLRQLTDSEDGAFQSYRDALGFAAALGFYLGKREPFESSDEPIPSSVFFNGEHLNDLILMLAAATVDDPEILGNDRLGERIRIFEEYANAGLIEMQQLTTAVPLVDALTQLVLQQRPQREVPSIESIVDGLLGD